MTEKDPNKKTRFTTYAKEGTLDQLKKLSEKTRVPIAAYMNEALEDLLEKYKEELEKK